MNLAPNTVQLLTTLQKEKKKEKLHQRISREKVRKESFFHHPMIGADWEIGSQRCSASARQEQHASIYASQLKRKKLHRFEPWPNDYYIKHLIRNPHSGILIAGMLMFKTGDICQLTF